MNPDQNPESPELQRVYVPLPDAKLERLLAQSAASGKTVEELIQEAVEKFLDERRYMP